MAPQKFTFNFEETKFFAKSSLVVSHYGPSFDYSKLVKTISTKTVSNTLSSKTSDLCLSTWPHVPVDWPTGTLWPF